MQHIVYNIFAEMCVANKKGKMISIYSSIYEVNEEQKFKPIYDQLHRNIC